MGLAFKPDIDDLRESPALLVAETLLNDKAMDVLLVEPNLDAHPQYELLDCNLAIEKADIVVYLVAHKEFRGHKKQLIDLDFCGVAK